MEKNFRSLMGEAKFLESYARCDDGHYESWDEAVTRVMDMHRGKYAEVLGEDLKTYIDFAERMYKQKSVLGAQRALQFGGDQLLRHNARLFNCSAAYADKADFFGECFYLMLCGCGVGLSVQKPHIATMPNVSRRIKEPKTFIVPDSIEGWARALDVLMSSFLVGGGVHQEYEQHKVYFDLEEIRPKGSFISGGFKAPGPEPLRLALDKIEQLIKLRLKEGHETLRPIDIYDITMHAADAVISGGVRRAATICLFSLDDQEMMTAKTGNWFNDNPQRGRSNNSVVLERDKVSYRELRSIIKSIKEFGEPGFVFTDDIDILFNPCCEISLYPKLGEDTGFQACNLSEINGGQSNTKEFFFEQCQAAAVLGTLQAGYTDFKFLNEVSQKIIEKESLIGVGITGWMNNPDILFDKEVMIEGAEIVKATNRVVSELIGINPAARCTTVKPAGSSSVLLSTTSGIHGEHAKRYIRNVQFNKDTEIGKAFKKYNPTMVEDSVWSASKTDYCVAFPVISPDSSIFKEDLLGVIQLEYVKLAQQYWVEYGTNEDLCVKPYLRHNVSNTITVDDWDEVIDYVYDNRQYLCGVSFLSDMGDKALPQSPFTEVLSLEDIAHKYGQEAMFTSGLVEAGLNAFSDDLWAACTAALNSTEFKEGTNANILKRDFVRRFEKFSKNFNSKVDCANCLKDVYLLHKWWKIQGACTNSPEILDNLAPKEYTDINTLGAQACSGGVCDIVW